jgi:alkanesulfonate monooxygenase SsuD/methylene tetrahydromethanopterin reductase-like flavin-dependent oxidoreductase (luciferase family)
LKVGLGLPNSDRSLASGRLLVDIARRAETLGFSTLGTIGRVAYPTYEELIVLAAAAAATERIGLMTDILLAATREPVLLAKQAATLDQVSGGRFVLGIGAGGRQDDFAVSGHDFHRRGRQLDAALDLMHRAWRGEPVPGSSQPVTPRPVNGHSVPLIFGGQAEPVIARIVKYGIGYTLGGGTPESLRAMMERVNGAWQTAGRQGKPVFKALGYFALGDEVAAEAEQNLKGYYGDFGWRVWGGALKSADEARQRVKAFEATGADELILFMAAPAVEQAERLAEAISSP